MVGKQLWDGSVKQERFLIWYCGEARNLCRRIRRGGRYGI